MDRHAARRAYVHIFNNMASVKDVTVLYKGGRRFSGFATHVGDDQVIMVPHVAHRDILDPREPLDFEAAVSIDVTLTDGSLSSF